MTNEELLSILHNRDLGTLKSAINDDKDILNITFDKVDFNGISIKLVTCIHIASAFGYLDVLQFLIEEAGVDLQLKSKLGYIPLHYSALGNQVEVMKYLIKKGSDVNMVNDKNITPLYIAMTKNAKESVRCLLLSGANAKIVTKDSNMSVLDYVKSDKASSVSKEIVDMILNQDNLINQQKIANLEKQVENLTRQVLDIQNNIQSQVESQIESQIKSQVEMQIQAILKGALKDAISKEMSDIKSSLNSLEQIVNSNKNEVSNEISNLKNQLNSKPNVQPHTQFQVQTIDNSKSDAGQNTKQPNPCDEYKKENLFEYIKNKDLKAVKCVIENSENASENSIDVNVKDDSGNSLLTLASSFGSIELIKYLLSKGASLDVVSKQGYNALMYASQSGHLDICKYLVAQGCNTQVNDFNVLMCASKGGYLDVCKYFVDSMDIDINAKNQNGDTAITLAKNDEIREYLTSLLDIDDNISNNSNNNDNTNSYGDDLI